MYFANNGKSPVDIHIVAMTHSEDILKISCKLSKVEIISSFFRNRRLAKMKRYISETLCLIPINHTVYRFFSITNIEYNIELNAYPTISNGIATYTLLKQCLNTLCMRPNVMLPKMTIVYTVQDNNTLQIDYSCGSTIYQKVVRCSTPDLYEFAKSVVFDSQNKYLFVVKGYIFYTIFNMHTSNVIAEI
jgi:hypothetical protein